MNTKFLGLVVVGSALISTLSSFDSASAATLNINLANVTYNLEVPSGKFQHEQTDTTSTVWLSNSSLANVNQLGLQGYDVPRFAHIKKNAEIRINSWLSNYNIKSGYNAVFTPLTSNTILTTTQIVRTMVSSTYASTTALPDPLSSLTAGCRFWRCL